MLSPWSPPAVFKTNGQRHGGGKCGSEHWDDWAEYICQYIKEFEERGFSVARISLQNEPHAEQKWDSFVWDGAEERDFLVNHMRVKYQDVVDQIMLRLDGRGLTEQAFYELHRKCQDAAYWANEKHEARYERKKDMIRLKEHFCAWRGWPYDDWDIYDKTKDLIKGLAHFETGTFDTFPDGMSRLFGWDWPKTDLLEFPSCNKVKQIKLYKNGRVDIRFTSAAYAEEFVGKYLAAA